MRALGRLVRGLSILFWTLPLTFVACIETARAPWMDFLGPAAFAPAVVLNAALLYGLLQMRPFQKQERVWLQALDRAEALALINIGLAPFLFWWRRFPSVPLYAFSAGLFVLTSVLFLIQVNRALQRLAAMIPDETVRTETRVFAGFNIGLLVAVFVGLSVYFGLQRFQGLPEPVARVMTALGERGLWLILFLTILPLAMTMALAWKIKEVIFAGIFSADG